MKKTILTRDILITLLGQGLFINRGEISQTTSINDLNLDFASGTYTVLGLAGVINTPKPVKDEYAMLLINLNFKPYTGNGRIQIGITSLSGSMYFRHKWYTDNWSSWKMVDFTLAETNVL